MVLSISLMGGMLQESTHAKEAAKYRGCGSVGLEGQVRASVGRLSGGSEGRQLGSGTALQRESKRSGEFNTSWR